MKVIRYLIPIWSGVFIYTIFSISFGAKGISAFNQLKAEWHREMENVEVLKNINGELENTRNSLSIDKKMYAVYARELGFASPEEHFIRIVGLGGPIKQIISPGQVVTARDPEHTPDRILRIISFFIAFTVFISIGAYDFLRFLKDRRRF